MEQSLETQLEYSYAYLNGPSWLTKFEDELTAEPSVIGSKLYIGNTGLAVVYENEQYELWFSPNGMTNANIARATGLATLHMQLFCYGMYHLLQNQDHSFLKSVKQISGQTNPTMGKARKKLFDEIDPAIFQATYVDEFYYNYTLDLAKLVEKFNQVSNFEGYFLEKLFRRINDKNKINPVIVVNPLLKANRMLNNEVVYEF